MDEPRQDPFPPQGVDLDRPSIARVYDYYLEGHTNWAIDREFGDRVLAAFPLIRPIAKANRQFLARVVRHLMRRGVRQFIDLGAGVPTVDHIHSIADQADAGSTKVVYVDHEPVAVAHAQILLEEQGDPHRHVAINADLRAPQRLWQQITETGLIDFSKPLAMLMIAVLHVRQQDEHGRDIGDQIVAHYRELLPRGSYLAISHITDEGVPADIADKLAQLKTMYDTSSSPVIWRSHTQSPTCSETSSSSTPASPGLPAGIPKKQAPAFNTYPSTTPANQSSTPASAATLNTHNQPAPQHNHALGMPVFFCDPRSPWQRPWNENTVSVRWPGWADRPG